MLRRERPSSWRGYARAGKWQQKGQGLDRDLLIEAIERAADSGAQVATRLMAADPIDQATPASCTKFGFRPIEANARGRRYLRIEEAPAALGGA